MARPRASQYATIAVLVLMAAAVGVSGALMVMNPDYAPASNLGKDPWVYDDDAGRIDRVKYAEAKRILVSWDGMGVAAGDGRTKERAFEIAEDLWNRYRKSPTESTWRELQRQYNEDRTRQRLFKVSAGAGLDPVFTDCALTTAIGKVRMSQPGKLGYYLIRREK